MASPGIGSGWRIAVRARREAVPIGNFMDRIMGFFGIPEEEDLEEVEETESGQPRGRGRNKVVSLHTQKQIRVVLSEPRSYEEAQEIADNLKSHRPVVINLQRVRREQAIRIIDFLSGTVYALGGSIHKLGSHIFMCTPANVDIQGTISDMLSEDTKDLLR
ncbi:cell division inhibitor SepF [Planifilum fulgidum]|uniref:Cell division protein SepF n=2 Tax=Planifilum fulgidum TaxID=201973 RepID=A0A1I2S8M9_9BACL|nr:cell division inhibitor SepF [Planifilum fulgidum]